MHRIHGIRLPGRLKNGWLFDPIREREEFLRKITLPNRSRRNQGSLIETANSPLQVLCTHADLISNITDDRRPGLVPSEEIDKYYWQT
jgi:hypothetical protein